MVLIAPSFATYLIVEKPLEHADAIICSQWLCKRAAPKKAELYKQELPRDFRTDDERRVVAG